jgi:hypothetical protein
MSKLYSPFEAAMNLSAIETDETYVCKYGGKLFFATIERKENERGVWVKLGKLVGEDADADELTGRLDTRREYWVPTDHLYGIEAGKAIAASQRSANVEPPKLMHNGTYPVWLPQSVVDRLAAIGRPGEDHAAVILRLAGDGEPREVSGA